MEESAVKKGRRRFVGIVAALPILQWLPSYRRRLLRGDVLAGAMVAALLIPQSLGYARIGTREVAPGIKLVTLEKQVW